MSDGKILDLEEYRKERRRNWDPLTVATEELEEAVTGLKNTLIDLFPEGFVGDEDTSAGNIKSVGMLKNNDQPPPSAG